MRIQSRLNIKSEDKGKALVRAKFVCMCKQRKFIAGFLTDQTSSWWNVVDHNGAVSGIKVRCSY